MKKGVLHKQVSGLQSILDQHRAADILTTYLSKDAIPHALLFSGPKGVGKKTMALVFAMACNCRHPRKTSVSDNKNPVIDDNSDWSTAEPCFECRSCRKIQSRSHPDIIGIQPSGSFIKIDQIRSLCRTLAMKPYEARYRVITIADAQAMNAEAGNALLKMLEEPPENTILILTTHQRSDLLPTIASRCQHIRFHPLSRKTITELLVNQHGISSEDAQIAAMLAGGSMARALSMAKPDWINWRNWLMAALVELPSWSITTRLAFAEKLSKNKNLLDDSFEIMRTWIRDMALYRYAPNKLIHRDISEQIKNASQTADIESLMHKLKAVQSAQKKIQRNANIRLTLELLAFHLSNG